MSVIIVKKGVRQKLMAMYEMSLPAVSQALLFRTNSLLARRVRSSAVNTYCGLYIENVSEQ